jgi:hypothetical protein
LLERTIPPLDDEKRLAREHEEVLLLRLPVIRPGRLAGAYDPDRHPEHREGRLGLVFVIAGERQAAALSRLVEPARVVRVHDERADARRDEARLRLLELCLGNHGRMMWRPS